jgi:SWI/SNF-related matrix-associated actin-dependent regulator of chromatin subfamily A member 5
MPTLLKILEEYLNYREYNYCKIYGGTRLEDRDEVIEAFNKEDNFVFLLSTGACGGGINLPTADVVIFYDRDWYALYYAKHDFVAHPRNRILILWYFCAFRNPHADLQALDRVTGIGQNKQVQVFRFCTEVCCF